MEKKVSEVRDLYFFCLLLNRREKKWFTFLRYIPKEKRNFFQVAELLNHLDIVMQMIQEFAAIRSSPSSPATPK